MVGPLRQDPVGAAGHRERASSPGLQPTCRSRSGARERQRCGRCRRARRREGKICSWMRPSKCRPGTLRNSFTWSTRVPPAPLPLPTSAPRPRTAREPRSPRSAGGAFRAACRIASPDAAGQGVVGIHPEDPFALCVLEALVAGLGETVGPGKVDRPAPRCSCAISLVRSVEPVSTTIISRKKGRALCRQSARTRSSSRDDHAQGDVGAAGQLLRPGGRAGRDGGRDRSGWVRLTAPTGARRKPLARSSCHLRRNRLSLRRKQCGSCPAPCLPNVCEPP